MVYVLSILENRPTAAQNGLWRVNNGLGDPTLVSIYRTPTKAHVFVHPLDCLIAVKCQQNLVPCQTNYAIVVARFIGLGNGVQWR